MDTVFAESRHQIPQLIRRSTELAKELAAASNAYCPGGDSKDAEGASLGELVEELDGEIKALYQLEADIKYLGDYYQKLDGSALHYPRIDLGRHRGYKTATLPRIAGHADSDELVIERVKDDLCPVTRMKLEKPVRNPPCGHVYSEMAIRSIAGRRSTIQCPVSGCTDTIFVAQLEPVRSLFQLF